MDSGSHRRVSADGHMDDPFDLPPLNNFPFDDEARKPAGFDPFPAFPTDTNGHHDRFFDDEEDDGDRSIHSDEFVDGEAFMADHKPGEDSFYREAMGGDTIAEWSESEELMKHDDGAQERRASAIFVPKSRNMDKVEFSSPRHSIQQKPVAKSKPFSGFSQGVGSVAFSPSHTAQSSEFDIHVDSRLVLTPNSLKYLQTQQRGRLVAPEAFRPRVEDSLTDSTRDSHSVLATEVVTAHASTITQVPVIGSSIARPSSAEKAMHSGPAVIKRALYEIESMLHPLTYDSEESDDVDPTLEKLKYRLMETPLPVRLSGLSLNDSRTRSDTGLSDSRRPTSVRSEGVGVQAQPTFEAREAGVQTDAERRASRHEQATQAAVSHADQSTSRRTDGFTQSGKSQSFSFKSKPSDATPLPHAVENDTHHISEFETPKNAASSSSASDASWATSGGVAATSVLSNVEAETPIQKVEVVPPVHNVEMKSPSEQPGGKPARPMEARTTTSYRAAAFRQSMEALDRVRDLLGSDNEGTTTPTPTRPRGQAMVSVPKKPTVSSINQDRPVEAKTDVRVTMPLATALPVQMARRCRRFLCSVGERMSEQIVFSNGSNTVGRICVSILPLSTGCQQFSVSPAVLELQPRSSSSFLVTLTASQPGVVAGIFQFRAVGRDCLYEPYEVMIEASVRGDLQLPPPPPPRQSRPPRPSPPQRHRGIEPTPKENRVTELPSQVLAGVQISPTFLRFSATNPSQETSAATGELVVAGSSIRVSNTTAETLKFQVKCAHEHLQLSPTRGNLEAGSTAVIDVQPLCQPFGSEDASNEDWCGSLTVIVGDVLSREVSVVVERKLMRALPLFDAVARVRQAISTQTDSFYYTKKVNRRGLYFHARAVECGSCVVGESHQVPVYICNGSDAPMTVFLQDLQDPFSCVYEPVTLQARKFIEVPITFTPKAAGKVATCLVAYTVTGKAAVTLIARGVDTTSRPPRPTPPSRLLQAA